MKKLLYLSDLYNFYVTQNKNVKFSSKDDDTTIVVHIDEPFTYSKNEENDLLMYTPIRLCHTLTNKNKSHIPEKAMKDAMSSAYNMPILGYIYKDENDTFQFAGHEFFVNEDNELEYEEQPCGTIPESAGLKLVKYDNDDRSYLEGTGIIWRTYSKASDIIEREKELSVSVELVVDELSFDSKTKELVIDKFRFSGVTILGKDRNSGEDIKPGMENAMISIGDFSEKNNSIFSQNEKVIEMLSALNEKIDNLNINNFRKEDDLVKKKFEQDSEAEVKAVTEAEIETPSENFDGDDNGDPDDVDYYGDGEDEPSDDDGGESEPAATLLGNGNDNSSDDNGEATPDAEPTDPTSAVDDGAYTDGDDDEDTGIPIGQKDDDDEGGSTKKPVYSIEYTVDVNGIKNTFAVTLRDKLMALTTLVNDTYADEDGAWYDVDADEDTKTVIFHDYWNDKHYRQLYTVKKGVYSLKGDRTEVFATYLSADEISQLDNMKANYSSIVDELASFKAEPDKEAVLADECYAQIKDTDAYKELAKKESHFSMSVDEVRGELDRILLEYAKGHEIKFSATEEKKSVGMKLFGNPSKKSSKGTGRYGGIFTK